MKNASTHNLVISIIIVVFNAENSLEQTLLSVINQTYKYIELIIIDGASTDNTPQILEKYSNHISKCFCEADKGIYDAMNKGIDVASGDWVLFLGSGDLLINVLDKIVVKLVSTNTIYYGDVFRCDLSKIYGGKYNSFKLSIINICHQAILYPLQSLKKYKYNITYRTLADHDLNIKLFGDSSFKFVYIPILFSIYEGKGFSEINKIDQAFFDDKMNIVKKNFPFYIFLYAWFRKKIAFFLRHYKLINAM